LRLILPLLFTVFLIFTLFLPSTPCLAQPVVEWSRTYGKAPLVGILDVKKTSDGFVMAGYRGNSYDDDAWIIKTDFNGKEEWNVSFGGKEIDLVSSIQKLSDGYIAAGFTGGAFADGWLIKIDDKGRLEWSRSYGGKEHDGFRWIEVIDDGYILAGSTKTGKDEDAWLVKTEFEGNVVWSKTYGGKGDDAALCVKEVEDGFIIAGFTQSFGNGKRDAWLIRVDFDGDEMWNITFGGELDDVVRLLQPIGDGFILVGYKETIENKMDAWVIKVDENGKELWNITFGGRKDDVASSVLLLSDGCLVAGTTESFGNISLSDGWLIKLDADGNEVWNVTLGGDEEDQISSIVKAKDGYVLAGSKQVGDGQAAWLVKVMERIEVGEIKQPRQAHQISPMQSFVLFLAGVAMVLYLLYRVLR
jgi:hypothetical protein